MCLSRAVSWRYQELAQMVVFFILPRDCRVVWKALRSAFIGLSALLKKCIVRDLKMASSHWPFVAYLKCQSVNKSFSLV